MPELKPCPFCGGKDISVSKFDPMGILTYVASCQECFGQTGFCRTPEAAIKAWNRRSEDEQTNRKN